MKTFVLVLFLTYGHRSGVVTVEYDTLSECKKAVEIAKKEYYTRTAYCLPGRR